MKLSQEPLNPLRLLVEFSYVLPTAKTEALAEEVRKLIANPVSQEDVAMCLLTKMREMGCLPGPKFTQSKAQDTKEYDDVLAAQEAFETVIIKPET